MCGEDEERADEGGEWGWRIGGGVGTHGQVSNHEDVGADSNPLKQKPVIETAAPPQEEREADAGEHTGDKNTGTPEVEGDTGMITGWDILKGIFLGNTHNEFKNLSRLDML